ncbi:nuclear speckle RNA-binding protein B-like [Gastrolobium bilobum]|uniref:nuclear speckle RNA-binding protein B-like n=1 Tax=Gastrolobium bilobum TaxID=150636 RepID=UPI002AB2E32F|nr:nuclear speckle RNA-binding protein B-like [Gastrolobium bilobum]
MSFSDIPTGRSPRRELQGPRPTPLSINKDSRKIKKPPLAPPPPQPSQPHAPPRQPIIIYTVSPKIIHTTPGDFMSLVQRLTGSSSSSSSSSSNSHKVSTNDPLISDNNGHGAISPAARYATIEKARTPQGMKQHQSGINNNGVDVGGGAEPSMFHGILSPAPASMSPIPASFFSPPPSDPSMVNFLHNLSPVLHSNINFMEGGFIMASPSNFFSAQTPKIDLFNNFLD